VTKNRLEAFSDGFFAVIITIMVLELKAPERGDWEALRPLWTQLTSYVLSFIFLGIYWNNHHHMLHLTTRVNGRILWWNSHLLFWLSLVPFATSWMGAAHFAPPTVALYGALLFCAGVAYTLLQRALIAAEGAQSKLQQAVGRDEKGKLSAALYAAAVPLAFVRTWISGAIYVLVALMWFIPDRRIESRLDE
jgi:uncharacterized membrane protein